MLYSLLSTWLQLTEQQERNATLFDVVVGVLAFGFLFGIGLAIYNFIKGRS